MLNQNHIDVVKSTIPFLEASGTALTEHFYQRLFRDNPELKDIFNLSHQHSGKQQVALFNAIAAYAKHIETPEVLASAINRIAHKHTSFNIQAEHYDVVGVHLIGTLKELGQEAITPEVVEAWTAAYQFLAGCFVDREATLYHQNKISQGGWSGTRAFRLVEKRIESELVKSLVFEPLDKQAIQSYLPGQYIGLKVSVPGHEHKEIRQYSLSARSNNKTYQISVKREIQGVPGVVSNYLHDGLRLGETVELSAPAGDFHYIPRNRPVVLISAGVGLTPMTAILDTLIAEGFEHAIQFIHACELREQHSFADKIAAASQLKNVSVYTWYKTSSESHENVFHGFMDLSLVGEHLPIAQGDFYLCGPVPFMQFAKQQLLTLGVDEERIHYEVFGPHEEF